MDTIRGFLNQDIPLGMLVIPAIMSLMVALFHSLIFSALFNKEKGIRSLYIIYPASILLTGFLIKPSYGMALFVLIFVSTFVLGIVLMLTEVFRSGMEMAKAKNSKASVVKKILGGFVALVFMLTFFVSPAFLFLLFFILLPFIASLQKSNKKTFYRSQASLPTSRIRSLSMGLAEIAGKAEPIKLMASPLRNKNCIGYYYTIEDISTDDEGHTSYHTVFSETKCNSFYLNDGTGKILIADELPELINFDVDYRYTSNQRHTQYLLMEGMQVLMIGAAKPGAGGGAVFGRDEVRKVFGISPEENVAVYNRTQPLRQAGMLYAYIFALLVALILVTPVKLSNGMIIFGKISLLRHD